MDYALTLTKGPLGTEFMAAKEFPEEHSVTRWIAALQADQSHAGQRLWERYVEKLARLARKKLTHASRRFRAAVSSTDALRPRFDQ